MDVLGVCVLRRCSSTHWGGPARHGHGGAASGAESGGQECPEQIRGVSISRRHWLLNTHTQPAAGYTIRHGPSRHIHTQKTHNVDVGQTQTAWTHQHSVLPLWVNMRMCATVCRTEDCCWIAVLVAPPQGAATLYEGLCMQDPYIVQLPGNTYTPTHTLNGSGPSLWGLETFGLPHLFFINLFPISCVRADLYSNRSSYHS